MKNESSSGEGRNIGKWRKPCKIKPLKEPAGAFMAPAQVHFKG